MIRLRTAIRVYPAAWLAPVLVLVCMWYARSMVFRVDPEPYLVGLSSQPVTTQGLVAPFVAALAAWEAARLRRGGVWNFPMVRRRSVVVAWPLALIWVVGIAAVAASVWLVVASKGFLLPDLRPLAVAGVVLAAHAASGFAFGLLLPLVAAAPLAMIVSLLWQVMPRAMQPLWTHLLTSQQLETCCGPAADIAPAALLAPVLVAVGVAGGSAVITLAKRSALTAAIAGSVLLAGVLAASAVASTQPHGDAHVARDERWMICEGTRPEVCVWPEHRTRLDDVAEIAGAAAAAWEAVGLEVPVRFDEAYLSARRQGVLRFAFALRSSRDQIISSMSYEMAPPYIECPGAFIGFEAFDPLRAWYAATAGMSPEGLELEFGRNTLSDGTEVLMLVEQVRDLPLSAQRDWMLRNEWAMGACDREPQLEVDR